jgi:pentatricopeptide repeat protein
MPVLPTAASYNALLEICYKSNDSDRALDVIDRMADDGVEPDDITWDLTAKKRQWRSYMRKVMG